MKISKWKTILCVNRKCKYECLRLLWKFWGTTEYTSLEEKVYKIEMYYTHISLHISHSIENDEK